MPSVHVASPHLDQWSDLAVAWCRAWSSLANIWLGGAALAPPMDGSSPQAGFPRYRAHLRGRTTLQMDVGDAASATRRITRQDIDMFASIAGVDDDHPQSEGGAQSLRERGGRAAHGMLLAGLISGVIGTLLPGPGSEYLSQTLRWVAPVRPGDALNVTVTVTHIAAATDWVTLETLVTRAGDPVLVGEAVVKAPPRDAREPRYAPVRVRPIRPGSEPRVARQHVG